MTTVDTPPVMRLVDPHLMHPRLGDHGVSTGLAVAASEALAKVNGSHLLPLVLSVFAPHASAAPRPADQPGAQLVDFAAVLHLVRAMHQHRAGSAIAPVLHAVGPWFTAPRTLDGNPDADTPTGEPLTNREFEALLGMSEGKTNGDIGRALGISEDTVKTHVKRMFRKLGVKDRAHAVRRGFELGHLLIGTNDEGGAA